MVGTLASDASCKEGSIDRVAAAICHPGGTSSGGGGSACVHLYVVKSVADVGGAARTCCRSSGYAIRDHV